MIRIHLQPRRGRLAPILLLGSGVFVCGVLGFFYLTREEGLHLPGAPTSQEEAPAQVRAEPPLAAATPMVGAPEPASPPSAAVPQPAPPQETALARAPSHPEPALPPRPPPAAAAAAGPVCLRILQLHEKLPEAVRCTSLLGTASGEYTIEGTVPAGDFPQLMVLLNSLPQQPSRPDLSSWRAGKKGKGDHNFNLHGQFPAQAAPALAPLETAQAAGLFTQAKALASKSRLDSVRVGDPLFTPLGKGVVQQRQKLWATGSYPQLRGFLENLVRQQPQLRLEEVMLVPHYNGEAQWKQAQFYAVLSAPVWAVR
ncbi:MAG: hypothetical protein FJY95_16625 [Candidatus Handelsmanbacteria bacterium]|nr:hypothetical protein [Candidatus Handelsmanbacteria bacterium]